MAIDYAIDFPCTPRENFTTDGILDRLKHRERAAAVIRMYREAGDERPPTEMGFDFTRSTPEGSEDTELIVVQDAINYANELDAHAHHCQGCPANRTGTPYGCAGFIQYPITADAEVWLLKQLPEPPEAILVWMLLKDGVAKMAYDGETVQALRGNPTYFENDKTVVRRVRGVPVNANQSFEMIFGVGDIQPNHAGILLLFFHAMRREIEADDIMNLTPAPADADERMPFLMRIMPDDDRTVAELKQFFHTLYVAWRLNVPVKMDV
jgi:hypothetical protein